MKGNKAVLTKLNALLADELTAISQYMVHAEMCSNWGYGKLHDAIQKRAIVEMKHAEQLIERILFLEGTPIVSDLNKITIGAKVADQFKNDTALEYGAVASYNDGVKICTQAADNATKEILEHILRDEDSHVDELEMYQDQIKQMGEQVFLSVQV